MILIPSSRGSVTNMKINDKVTALHQGHDIQWHFTPCYIAWLWYKTQNHKKFLTKIDKNTSSLSHVNKTSDWTFRSNTCPHNISFHRKEVRYLSKGIIYLLTSYETNKTLLWSKLYLDQFLLRNLHFWLAIG